MQRRRRYYVFALSFALGTASNVLGQGNFTTIDFPGAASTLAWSINSRGDIVGGYTSAGVTHGFKLSGGQFVTIDFPGAAYTEAYGVNARGDVVGW